MVSSGSGTRTASGGTWQQSRANPALPASCGLRVALIMDLSGSMNGSVGALKTAANNFVDSLQGTPSSMARFTFSSFSPADQGGPNAPALASVSTTADATAFKSAYAGWTEATASGATNWDRALYEPALASQKYDVAVLITDGMPTRYGTASGPGGNGSTTRLRELENGIFSANALKAEGTRVLAVGVGSGTTGDASYNLAAISGPTRYNGANIEQADYFQETNFSGAGAALRQLALANCTPSLSVVKQIREQDGTLVNAPQGWTFDGSTDTAGAAIASPQTTTSDGTGAVNFPLTYDAGVGSADFAVTEEQKPRYTVVQQGGRNASCYDKVSEQPVDVVDAAAGPGFTVPVSSGSSVTCTVINQAPPEDVPATLTVDKEWEVMSGGVTHTYPQGDQPGDLRAALRVSDPTGSGSVDAGWDSTLSGYSAGQDVVIAEQNTIGGNVDCELTAVEIDGRTVDPGSPSTSVGLEAGANEHSVVNHVTCHTRLRVAKTVLGGDADPASWNLRGIAGDGSLPGPDGVTGSAEAEADVTPGARYQLAEQLQDDDPDLLAYQQIDVRTDYQSNPLSTGSANCLAYDRDGQQLLGWNDGINGGVNVALGLHVTCTLTNETVPLTLVKNLTGGGPATPADWQLTATPVAGDPDGVPARTVTGASGEGVTVWVRPGRTYRLSESAGPTGYTLASINCTSSVSEPGGPGEPATEVTVLSGTRAACTFTNTYEAPQSATLTLEKKVANEHGGTAEPRDWTLTATGPDTVRGRTGDESVTGADVAPGTYDLSEDGPDGYRPSGWTCAEGDGTALPVTADHVTLPAGADVTCTITNTDREHPSPPPTVHPTCPPKYGYGQDHCKEEPGYGKPYATN